MRFWDSSAIVPLLVREDRTDGLVRLVEDDPAMVVWWGSQIECHSALARLEREGRLIDRARREADDRLSQVAASWAEVPPVARVREQAVRMLRVHPLRGADALQLAAALVSSDFEPGGLEFVTLDRRLEDAANREGFRVVTE